MSAKQNIISKIFDCNIPKNDFDCELFLLEKLMDNCNDVGYMFDYMKKISECLNNNEEHYYFQLEKYSNIVKKYINHIFCGKFMTEHTQVCMNWISNHKFDNWDLLITDTNINHVHHMVYNKKIQSVNIDVVLHNIKKIYSNVWAPELLRSPYYNGYDCEQDSVFSWIVDNNITYDKFYCVYDTINELYKKSEKCFLQKLGLILNLNKSYSYYDISMIEHSKLSSFKFMYMLSKILLKLSIENLDSNMSILDEKNKYDDINYYEKSSIEDMLAYLTLKYLYVCYNVMFYMQIKGETDSDDARKFLDLDLQTLTFDSEYFDMVGMFLSLIINKKIYLESELFFIICENLNIVLEDPYFDISDSNVDTYIKYMINIIGGTSSNPYMRQKAIFIISKILDKTKLDKYTHQLIDSLLYHICKIDTLDIYNDEDEDGHVCDFTNIIKNLDYKKIATVDDISDCSVINKTIYKLISMSIGYISEIGKSDDDDGHYLFHASMLIESIGIIYNNLFFPLSVPRELTLAMLNLADILFKTYRKYGNIDDVLILRIQDTISIFIDVDPYRVGLTQIASRDELLDAIEGHQKEEKIKMILCATFDSKHNHRNLDIPDKFLDPLLLIQIMDPVMIPNVDLVFDRASIISQLYNMEINPYTRELLTLKQFEQYNTIPHIIKKLEYFKIEYNNWLKMSE